MLLPLSGVELQTATQLPAHLASLHHFASSSLALADYSAPPSFALAAAELTGNDVANFAGTVEETFVESLKGKFLGVIVGNFLAALAFAALTAFFQNAIAEAITKVKWPFSGDDSTPQQPNVSLNGKPASSGKIQPLDPTIATATTPIDRIARLTPDQWTSLGAALLIDAVGDSSFLLPGVGELEDVVWAPISFLATRALFGSGLVASFDAVKEALPGTDILPVATIAWTLQNIFPDSKLAQAAGLGPGPNAR